MLFMSGALTLATAASSLLAAAQIFRLRRIATHASHPDRNQKPLYRRFGAMFWAVFILTFVCCLRREFYVAEAMTGPAIVCDFPNTTTVFAGFRGAVRRAPTVSTNVT